MFQEQDATSGFQNAKQFGHRFLYVGNTAQRDRADNAIKCGFVERKLLAADDPFVHGEAGLFNTPLQPFVHAWIRIGGGYPFDVLRVMRQIQTCTDTNFQNLTVCAGKLLLAVLRPDGLVHQAIIEAWEDDIGIETQLDTPKKLSRTNGR